MTERICYLHFGLPKTGTTALQAALTGYNSDTLRYADLGHPNHATPLTLLFSEDPFRHSTINTIRLYSRPRAQRRIERSRRRLTAEITKDRKSMIFSGETVPQRLRPSEFAQMRDFMLQHFDRIEVITYVRPWMSLAPSAWQERVKNGSPDFEVPIPRYRSLLKPLVKVFGAKATTFVPFVRDRLTKGDIVDDFAARVGIDGTTLPRPERNLSHSLEATAVLFAFNRMPEADKASRRKVEQRDQRADALYGFGQGRIGFAPALMQAVQAEHQDDLDWVSKFMDCDMVGSMAKVDHPLASAEDVLALADQQMAVASVVIAKAQKTRAGKLGLLRQILRRFF